MKKKNFLFISLLVIAFTGCSGNNAVGTGAATYKPATTTPAPMVTTTTTTTTVATTTTTTVSAELSSAESEKTEEINSEPSSMIELYAPGGDLIDYSELTSVNTNTAEGEQIEQLPEKLEEGVFFNARCEGFTYLAQPSEHHYNSIENADIYDSETWNFAGAPELSEIEYKRYNVGDTVGGLTVKAAEITFGNNQVLNSDDLNDSNKEILFQGGWAEFEGTVQLTGYMAVAPEDDGYTTKRDLLFVPDSSGFVFPVMNYYFYKDKGVLTPVTSSITGNVVSQDEYPPFQFGNADAEVYSGFDFSKFPADGTSIPVKVTVDNIKMQSYTEFVSYISAEITELEIIG